MTTLSARSKLALRRLGLESTARRVVQDKKVAALRWLSSYKCRRDTKDDAHLSLLMSFILSDDSGCIDIGASRGKILQQMLTLAPNGRHLAFEPIPEMADRLRRLFPKVSVEAVALSDENGTARFSRILGEEGYSSLSDRQFSGSKNIAHLEVPTARLDDVVPYNFAPSLIKIDVEGAEYLVISGARETLKKYKPTIWFEHGASSAAYFKTTSAQIWDLLHEFGYRIFDSDGHGPIQRAEFGVNPRMWSFVAH